MRNEWFCSWRHYIDQLCVKTNNRDSPNPQPGMISWRCHEMKSNGDWIGWTNLNEDLLGFNVVSYFSAIYKPLHGHKQQLDQLYIYIFGDIADLGPWKEDHGSQSVLWPRRRSQSQCICEHHKAFQIWAIWAWCHFQIAAGWWRTQSHDGNRHLETPGARNAPSVLTPAMASRISHETVRVEHSMHVYIYILYIHIILYMLYIYVLYILNIIHYISY
jgi:hypothetical protein